MKKEFLETGKIVSTHGLHGDVKILPWADSPEFLLEFDRVFVGKKEYAVEDARVQKTCVLMKLKGLTPSRRRLNYAIRLFSSRGRIPSSKTARCSFRTCSAFPC